MISIARQLFPHIQTVDYRTSVVRALAQLDPGRIESTWNDPLDAAWSDVRPVRVTVHEGIILEHHKRIVPASAAAVYKTFTSLGGEREWFNIDWAWRMRVWIGWLAGWVSGAAAEIRMNYRRGMCSISGGWKPWNPGGC